MATSSSSEAMDESFEARVAKAFGSLSSSQSSSPSPSSLRPLWSLTDAEVEKREWNRKTSEKSNRDDETPCSSSFFGLFAKDRREAAKMKKRSRGVNSELDDDEDLNDDDDDDDDGDERMRTGSPKQGLKGCGDDDEGDEWLIRSSIGLDCTLDNEEEEDEFDKVAEGRENAGDRLYMRDATDHGPYLNSHNVLSYLINDDPDKPRDNHVAARVRLRDDEAAAHEDNPFQTADKSIPNVEEPRVKVSEDGSKPKSILKRKDDSTGCKSQKRVRFDAAHTDECDKALERPEEMETHSMETKISDDDSSVKKNTLKVPDYLLNPSKYTCYSLDSASDVDEASNTGACMDFLNAIKRSKATELVSGLDDESADIPKSVTFIPRKKSSEAKPVKSTSVVNQNLEDESKNYSTQTGFHSGIVAGAAHQSEVCAMEEDDPDKEAPEKDARETGAGPQKPGRVYRNRAKLEDTAS